MHLAPGLRWPHARRRRSRTASRSLPRLARAQAPPGPVRPPDGARAPSGGGAVRQLSDAVESAGRRVQDPGRSPAASRWAGRSGASSSSGSPSSSGELRLGFTQLAALYVLSDARDAHRRRARRGDRPVALGHEPAGGRARGRSARRAAPRTPPTGASAPWPSPGAGASSSRWWTAPAPTSSSASSGRCRRRSARVVAMAVAALATRAVTRRGRLIKAPEGSRGRA